MTDAEVEDVPVAHGSSSTSHAVKIPGVHKTTARSHGRTSDLLAGGLGRTHVGEKSTLWVCQLCFKYMADGNSYELHVVRFIAFHPIIPVFINRHRERVKCIVHREN